MKTPKVTEKMYIFLKNVCQKQNKIWFPMYLKRVKREKLPKKIYKSLIYWKILFLLFSKIHISSIAWQYPRYEFFENNKKLNISKFSYTHSCLSAYNFWSHVCPIILFGIKLIKRIKNTCNKNEKNYSRHELCF